MKKVIIVLAVLMVAMFIGACEKPATVEPIDPEPQDKKIEILVEVESSIGKDLYGAHIDIHNGRWTDSFWADDEIGSIATDTYSFRYEYHKELFNTEVKFEVIGYFHDGNGLYAKGYCTKYVLLDKDKTVHFIVSPTDYQ